LRPSRCLAPNTWSTAPSPVTTRSYAPDRMTIQHQVRICSLDWRRAPHTGLIPQRRNVFQC